MPQSWSGKSLSQLDLRGQYNLNILGFRDYENAPLDFQFGPNDLLKPDTYIMAVINNQYLDYLVRLND
ncbi:potassium transporter Trk [Streptococcus parasanguinis]|uniref:Potassium transporter Trk n=1 Tax=Streptococcus parasanguinis TaxID=1318 RepID=A0A7X3BQ23_STRPA|nr:potassium transporter Trk [Streptococcus parasanguinis]RYS54993.1 potassium transporter Trk [Streptococcus parasanguinis]